MLTGFTVVQGSHDFDVEEATLIISEDGRQRVLAVIGRETLDDLFPARTMTFKQRNALVESNLAAFGRIVTAMYEAGEMTSHRALPLVTMTSSDIKRSGEKFTDSVLDAKFRIADKAGRF
jgi:hypothetical protein